MTLVTTDLGNGWTIEMHWSEDETQGGPGSLVIRPTNPDEPPPGGLSSTVLRGIDFRQAKADLHRQLSEHTGEPGDKDLLRDALSVGITDEYLALLSSEYVARVDSSQSKPVDRLAEELGKSPGTIKGHLWQARKRGLLTEGSPGRKGGRLSPEAVSILARM